MDLEDNHFEEVYGILFKHPHGLEFQPLYQKCKSFPEGVDLSRCLHRASQQGNIFKSAGIYKLTTEKYKDMSGGQEPPTEEEKSDPITEAIKELVAKDSSIPKLPDTQPIQTEPEPKPARVIRSTIQRTKVGSISGKQSIESKGFGNLQRSKTLGGTALALYKARDTVAGLTMEDLIEWTGSTKLCLYQVLPKLIERKYIVRDGVPRSRSVRYRWSGNFRYPFVQWEKEDDELLKYPSILAFQNRGDSTTRVVAVPPEEVQSMDAVEKHTSGDMVDSVPTDVGRIHGIPTGFFVWGPQIPLRDNDSARTLIDLQLKSLQAHMEVLTHMRQLLSAEA